MTNWNFANQNLTGACFYQATLAGTDFTAAEIRGADFRNTVQKGLTAAQLYSTASYSNEDLSGVALAGIDLSGWDFRGINLSGADLSETTLAGAQFAGTNLSGVDLSSAILTETDFTGATLTGANLDLAELPDQMPELPVIAGVTVAFSHELTVSGAVDIEADGTLYAMESATLHGDIVNEGLIKTSRYFMGTEPFDVLRIDGRVTGGGDTAGHISFAKEYSPGDGAAITSHEEVTFEATNLLTLEIGGLTPGEGYDQLMFTGRSILGGALLIEPINGFMPEVGDCFQLFDWYDAWGTFDEILTPAWLKLDTSDLYLTGVVYVTAVPEPAAFALTLSALVSIAILGCLRPRNRHM